MFDITDNSAEVMRKAKVRLASEAPGDTTAATSMISELACEVDRLRWTLERNINAHGNGDLARELARRVGAGAHTATTMDVVVTDDAYTGTDTTYRVEVRRVFGNPCGAEVPGEVPEAGKDMEVVEKVFEAAFREMYPRAGASGFKRQRVAMVLDAFLHAVGNATGGLGYWPPERWKRALRHLMRPASE